MKNTSSQPSRRTTMTRTMIKDAMLELLSQHAFDHITVSGLCRQADVGRATFYLHYDNLIDVIRELADDAILATEESDPDLDNINILAQKMRETTDPEQLEPFMYLLPVCQRVADQPKYRPLFHDDFVADYIVQELYRTKRDDIVGQMRQRYHMTERQAELLFRFTIYGAFSINQELGWKKNTEWYDIQKVLMTFLSGGYSALEKL